MIRTIARVRSEIDPGIEVKIHRIGTVDKVEKTADRDESFLLLANPITSDETIVILKDKNGDLWAGESIDFDFISDPGYPYAYAYDLIRIASSIEKKGVMLSREQAHLIVGLIANICGMWPDKVKQMLADFYIENQKDISLEDHKKTREVILDAAFGE